MEYRGVGVHDLEGSKTFTFPYGLYRFWGPPRLLSNAYRGEAGSFPGVKAAGGVKLTTHLQLVPKSGKHPLPTRPHGVVLS
jgi:hypothetical protein